MRNSCFSQNRHAFPFLTKLKVIVGMSQSGVRCINSRRHFKQIIFPAICGFISCTFLFYGCSKEVVNKQPNSQIVSSQVKADSDGTRSELKSYIENVTTANASRYGATDNAGRGMDCAKIIADQTGGFLAVYHSGPTVYVATSNDILYWGNARALGTGTQPTIKAAGYGFVAAWESEPNNHVILKYYNSRDDLLNARASKSFDAPRTLSSCAEGTPNLYYASSSYCDVGFHYFSNCDVDRQARATTNWNNWNASKQNNMDNAILYWGTQGNIGDRDGMLQYKGYNFGLMEGQYTKNDFGSWRSFIYDYQTGNADPLNIRTAGGSFAFANPNFELVRWGNQAALIVTMFLPSEGVRGGDRAGELIYYKTFNLTNTGIVFYQDINYGGGVSQILGKGNYTLEQLQAKGVHNDWASSCKIPAGWKIIIYQHDNFQGQSWTLYPDANGGQSNFPGYSGLNDVMSSCKIL